MSHPTVGELPRELAEAVSVIMRFHDPAGIGLLERAVQSLHAQEGAVVQPIVVTQRFSAAELAMVTQRVRRQFFFEEAPEPIVVNLDDGQHGDARSRLLNLGIEEHLRLGNRYLAFLDYDDLMYSNGYSVLLNRLRHTGAVVAFASVDVVDAVPLADYEFIYEMSNPYRGANKLDLVRNNFCPLHSYVVDTAQVDRALLHFNPDLTRVEDYDFLLKVAGPHPCDFKALSIKVGLYVRRSDGSNSTPFGTGSVIDRESGSHWKDSHAVLERLRADYPIRFFASDF